MDVVDLDELLERGEFTPIREWLRANNPRARPEYPPPELLGKAVGSGIDARPYLGYFKQKCGAAVAV